MFVTVAIVSLAFRPAFVPAPHALRVPAPAMQYRQPSAAERQAARDAARGLLPPPPAVADDATRTADPPVGSAFVGQAQSARYAQPPPPQQQTGRYSQPPPPQQQAGRYSQPPPQQQTGRYSQPPPQQQTGRYSQPPPPQVVGQTQMTRAQQLKAAQDAAFGMKPQASAGVPQLDVQTVEEVLTEFCMSDYARQLYDYCNVGPTEYGKVRGMFESVRVVDSKLVVRLQGPFQQRSEKLMDKLAKHLRQRMPEVQRLMHESGRPATIRTYII